MITEKEQEGRPGKGGRQAQCKGKEDDSLEEESHRMKKCEQRMVGEGLENKQWELFQIY